MERFRKEITIDNKSQVFEFTRMRNMNGVKFFITSKDANEKPIAFSLKEAGDNIWKLIPGSLRWLYQIETELSNAIRETRMK